MASVSFDVRAGNGRQSAYADASWRIVPDQLSFSYNKYLNNFSFDLMLEPRFLARTRRGNVGGASSFGRPGRLGVMNEHAG